MNKNNKKKTTMVTLAWIFLPLPLWKILEIIDQFHVFSPQTTENLLWRFVEYMVYVFPIGLFLLIYMLISKKR